MLNNTAITKKNILRPFLLVFLLTLCAGFNQSAAQSVVGQWKQVSVKAYCTPEAVKNSQGHLQAIMEMPKVDATEDFHSDNTFVETINSEGKKIVHTGTWSLIGNTITITVNGDKLVGKVSNDGRTLVCTIESPKTEHMQITKREWTYIKV
jgi:hypothetical protein